MGLFNHSKKFLPVKSFPTSAPSEATYLLYYCTFSFPRVSSLGPSRVTKQFLEAHRMELASSWRGDTVFPGHHCLWPVLGGVLLCSAQGQPFAFPVTGATQRLGRWLSPGHCVFTESHALVFALQLLDSFLNFEVNFKTSDKITKPVQTVLYTISPASPRKNLTCSRSGH